MRLLLDTQLVLWAAAAPGKIPKKFRGQFEKQDNTLVFSAASLWEISIKNSLGRDDFNVNTSLLKRGLVDNGWEELPITGTHAIAVEHLPSIHQDPFDRIILAQAEVEGFMLYTSDKTLAKYPGSVKLVRGGE